MRVSTRANGCMRHLFSRHGSQAFSRLVGRPSTARSPPRRVWATHRTAMHTMASVFESGMSRAGPTARPGLRETSSAAASTWIAARSHSTATACPWAWRSATCAPCSRTSPTSQQCRCPTRSAASLILGHVRLRTQLKASSRCMRRRASPPSRSYRTCWVASSGSPRLLPTRALVPGAGAQRRPPGRMTRRTRAARPAQARAHGSSPQLPAQQRLRKRQSNTLAARGSYTGQTPRCWRAPSAHTSCRHSCRRERAWWST
mmetsp:Transcript_32491/g.96968  ORF Transcript_32491/g.96968 Transcript_32491/m.96968 type:complete len:259 (+) Transcript_32491:486-1262(+)